MRTALATEAMKLVCLLSSGTMANIESWLNHVVRMATEESGGRGCVKGRRIEVLTSDPASDWPLHAEIGRQMLQQKVAALFACWTSLQRKSVPPLVEHDQKAVNTKPR